MTGLLYGMTALKLTPLLAISFSSEEEARRMIGLFVVAGMIALILKGFLIARWFANRRKKRQEAAAAKRANHDAA